MAYSAANLTRIGGASNGDLWFYTSADAIATVNTSGYFNDAANMLAVRDLIIVVDTNTPTTNFVNVLSNTGTVVDVSDGTAVVETDGD
jgi:accessory colonization factor AcfC